MTQHDNSYKLFFSHPEMVRDLLAGFIHQPWVAELDLTTLEIVSGSYVADDLRDREDDIIWRVRLRDRWLYLYLLLEFQSTVDAHMAVRVLTYLGLLYQDLIRQKQFTPNGLLPPVLPIVLYNGKPRWRAALNISQLIEAPPGRLRDYTPQLKYLLLDEGAIDETSPLALRNLVAALFGMEKSRGADNADRIVGLLANWLDQPEQASLRRAFVVWIKRVFLPGRLPGVDLTKLVDLMEIKTMLAESVVEWTEQWKQQGLQQGLQQGEAKVLERQLTKRFGPLSQETSQRLHTATAEQLELWADRILDAATLATVFSDH
ncbi:MAG: Rpn family recombination-promoting nuclease/putative transposase [Rhodoferax sp.]